MTHWSVEMPLVKHIRELRERTGASTSIGWMYDEPAFLLYALVKWYKPELVIQTGHLWGKSAMVVLAALRDGFLMSEEGMLEPEQEADKTLRGFVAVNRPEPPSRPKVISIDPQPKGVPNSDAGVRYLKEYDPDFEFHQMKSSEFFGKHAERLGREFQGRRIMGIVDGDHTWEGAMTDLEELSRIGAGLIIFDDMTWLPHLRRAAGEFARRRRYEFLNLPFFTGMGILWKKRPLAVSPKANRFPFSRLELLYVIGGFTLINFARRVKHIFFRWAA